MNQYDFLLTKINSAKAELEQMPAFMKLEREYLLADIEEWEEELKNTPEPPPPTFKMTLTFTGPCVKDCVGIQSDFVSDITSKFQKIVRGIGKDYEGIQRDSSGKYDLMITNVAKGSFGFVMEAMPDEEPVLFDNTFLEDAVEKIGMVLDAAQKSDDEAGEALGDLSDASVAAIYTFAKTLADKGCGCSIGTSKSKFPIRDFDSIRQRLDQKNIHEESLEINGILTGFMGESKKFEIKTEDGTIAGKIPTDFLQPLKELFDKEVHVKVHFRQIGKGKKNYTIEEVIPLDTSEETN